MFSLREFIKKGLLNAVGNMADYQIILNAIGWYEKNVLLEEDLEEINNKIDEKNGNNIEVNEEVDDVPEQIIEEEEGI